eukprot:s1712_g7.t1
MVSYYAPKGKGGAEPFATYSLEEEAPPDTEEQRQQRPSSASSSSVSYYGSLAGRGLKKASVVLSATDAAVREGRSGLENLQRRQVLGSLHMARSMEELQAVIETRLPEMDNFACTVALHRLARCSHDVDQHVQNDRMVRPEAVNPTRTSLSQREQRLWRASLSASAKQHPSFTVLIARLGDAEALKQAQPRQLANISWALARLRALECLPLLRTAATRCAGRQGPGEWDPMSISLIPWSLATMGIPELRSASEILDMVRSINTAIREQGSAAWAPGDLSRVLWSWAKLAQRDDTFFRRASCLIMSRMPEYTPSQLAQTVWAFATVAPQELVAAAADAMLRGGEVSGGPSQGSGLTAYTPQHLAMAVWSFAAVLYRPEELLEQIGKDLSNTVWAFASAGEYDVGFMDAVAAETCKRGEDFHGQHLAMVAWAFITLRHRHDPLLRVIGQITNGYRGLGSPAATCLVGLDTSVRTWSNAKLLAFSFAGLPRLGPDARLGSEAWTVGAVRKLLDQFYDRFQAGTGEVDADDAWVVHDAALNQLLATQRLRLQGMLEASEEFAAILVSEQRPETSIIRRYQDLSKLEMLTLLNECLQTFRIRGLGSDHTWRLLAGFGALPVAAEEVAALRAGTEQSASKAQTRVDGRGERQNWCFFRASVHVPAAQPLVAAETGRLLNSSVVKYREDSPEEASVQAQEMLRTGARPEAELPRAVTRDAEASVQGQLQLFMTEVPCLSCIGAMAQFRRRFPNIALQIHWEGFPEDP